MNIIFGKRHAEELKNKFIILELDTIQIGDSAPITSYCVVDNVPKETLNAPEEAMILHHLMIAQFQMRDWQKCLESIDDLYDKWGLEMNTFYDHIRERVKQYLENEPDDTWQPIIKKSNN